MTHPCPLPVWLEPPALAVLADLQGSRPIDVRIGYLDLQDDPHSGWLCVIEDGEFVYGFAVPTEARGADLLLHIADGLQNDFSLLRGAWSEARPVCPGHPHPLEPEELSGEAWWVCPRAGTRVMPIGGDGS